MTMKSKIKEGINILKDLGLPKAQQNERSALTLLAVLDLRPSGQWSKIKKQNIRIHDILAFIKSYYEKKYAENTRETIRRQTLHQFEQAGIVIRNTDDPTRPTNSPNTVYMISDEALKVLISYKTNNWKKELGNFIQTKGKLVDKYERRKIHNFLTVEISGSKSISLSPGKHNKLQIAIIDQLKPRFCPKAEIIYVGDTASKLLHINNELLKGLNIPITQHDKLPDVVLYDKNKNHLLLIEAVTAHGPISPTRFTQLENALSGCKIIKIYISAFPDFAEFKKHIGNIAWETEVWIADNPDHMIHFNGPKFFTAY